MLLEKRLKRIEEIIQANVNHYSFSGPVPKSEILRAEKDLQIKFPISYLWFLLTFGSGVWNECEIFGMTPVYDPTHQFGIPYVVSTTQILREKFNIPSRFFAVSGDGGRFYYLVNAGDEERKQDADLYLLDVNTSQVDLLIDEQENTVQLSDFYEAVFENDEI